MRNTIISIISILLIAAYSIFSLNFINSFTKEIETKISYADSNGYNNSIADDLQKTVEKNMEILLFTTSKEHIDTIEECVINIRFATEYGDTQGVQVYKNLLLSTIKEISRVHKSPI